MKKLFLFFALISFPCVLWAQSGKAGDLAWSLSGNTLTISGFGDMPNYRYYEKKAQAPWIKDHRQQIKIIIIKEGVTSIGNMAFHSCTNLTSVTIPNSVTNIGNTAFYSCSGLTSVTIPNSVTNIGFDAFYLCSGLTSITIPNSVTRIGNTVFYSCSNLTSVTIPNSVTSIGYRAFGLCEKLSDITVNWKNPLIFSVSNYPFSGVSPSATLHVPAGTKSLYQQAEIWKEFNIAEEGSVDNSGDDLSEIEWLLPPNSTVETRDFIINACINSKTQIEQVNILVNGESNRGITNAENNNCSFSIKQNVILTEGSNTIKLQVRNAAGTKEAERIVNYVPILHSSLKNKCYALIIGNGQYAKKSLTLKNPKNDATDIAKKLKQLGFMVVPLINANKQSMENAIRNIATNAKDYSAVMFFYAGHGLQHKGDNWLLPVDADLESSSDIEKYCVNLGWILGKMDDAGCQLKIAILDACRSNPSFQSMTRGDDKMKGLIAIDAPVGCVISYATKPGGVARDGNGRNSPYTEEILRCLDKSGLSLLEFFQEVGINVYQKTQKTQEPWVSLSPLTGTFYFNEK